MNKFYILLTLIVLFCFGKRISYAQTSSFAVKDGLQHCVGDTVQFANQSTGYTSLYWDFGDGYNTYIEDPFHIYSKAGDYAVKLTAISLDPITSVVNRHEFTLTVSILAQPIVQVTPDSEIKVQAGSTVEICAAGNFDNITWSTGETTPCIEVTTQGYFWCQVSSGGCTAQDTSGVIKIIAPAEASEKIDVVNNIMTPNGDGKNDWLFIENYEQYELPIFIQIYNVWGELLFESNAYENNWDATFNGKPLDAGTYYYHIKSEGKQESIGFVDIIR